MSDNLSIECYIKNQEELDIWAPIIAECKSVSQESRELLPVEGKVMTDEDIEGWGPKADLWIKIDDGNDAINIPLHMAQILSKLVDKIDGPITHDIPFEEI